MKIVITQNLSLSDEQLISLKSFGDVTQFDTTPTNQERLDRVQGADIILSEEPGLHEGVTQLKDTFVTFPFTGFLREVDTSILKDNNVVCSGAKGGNKYAVAEWVMTALLTLTRKIKGIQNESIEVSPADIANISISGLYGRDILILGKGSIGSTVGNMLEGFGANITYFTRSSSPLDKEVVGKDIIINCLSEEEEILNSEIWNTVGNTFYYITASRPLIHNLDSIKNALESGIMLGFGCDSAQSSTGDYTDAYYQKCKKLISEEKRLFITPHIAWATSGGIEHSNEVMIENIKAYIEGNPVNVVS